jgi:membrane-associated phospholipid phosphatase
VKYQSRTWLVQHTIRVSFLAVLLVVFSIYFLDQMVSHFFKRPDLELVYKISREITNVGLSGHYFALSVLAVILSRTLFRKMRYFQKRPGLEKMIEAWALFLLKCLVVIGVVCNIIKFIFGRQRPHSAENFENLNFSPFTMDGHWLSFPSGHTQVLFTLGTFLTLLWPRHALWFLLTAALLAFTRVSTFQHFCSDFVAGAALGYLGTLWLYQLWPPKN